MQRQQIPTMKGNMNMDVEVNAIGNVQAEFEDEAI
jgi:hypothetical protein